MHSLFVAAAADQDIYDVLISSEDAFGKAARFRYKKLLDTAFNDLVRNPCLIGSKSRPDLAESVRVYHLRFSRKRARTSKGIVQNPRHFLLYRFSSSYVEIGRILHDSMDIEIHLPENYRRG